MYRKVITVYINGHKISKTSIILDSFWNRLSDITIKFSNEESPPKPKSNSKQLDPLIQNQRPYQRNHYR